jgi:hypothetical protein
MLFALNLQAAHYSVIIRGQEPSFEKASNAWGKWLVSTAGADRVYLNATDTRKECKDLFSSVKFMIRPTDTLSMVLIGHGVVIGKKLDHSMLLADSEFGRSRKHPMDFVNYLYEADLYQFLQAITATGVRVIMFVDCCVPYSIMSKEAAQSLPGTTVVYSTQTDNLADKATGLSLFAELLLSKPPKQLSKSVSEIAARMKDDRIYRSFTQYSEIKSLIPIQPLLIGQDFTFRK